VGALNAIFIIKHAYIKISPIL